MKINKQSTQDHVRYFDELNLQILTIHSEKIIKKNFQFKRNLKRSYDIPYTWLVGLGN